MDIVGIVVLFRFGAIGGKWIEEISADVREFMGEEDITIVESMIAGERLERERRARFWAGIGLLLAVGGFGLQIWAQWV